jgi:hypothetical protein
MKGDNMQSEKRVAIKQPDILQLRDKAGHLYYGAQQTWYKDEWQKKAGCGPTTAAQLVYYLALSRADCAKILSPLARAGGREGFTTLMDEVWQYVTPGNMGTNSTELFTGGLCRYGERHNLKFSFRVLSVPPLFGRPTWEHLASFMRAALSADLPVAFLNLSNGRLDNLDNWHWVTLVELDADEGRALMYDDGDATRIDLKLWLKTTLLGGGFVAVEPLSFTNS